MARMRIEDLEIRDADIYRIVLDNFPDIVHSVDQDGAIIYANKAAAEVLGYSNHELLAMNIHDLYAPEVRTDLERGFLELKQQGDKFVETVLLHRDGTRVPVEMRSFSVYDDDGNFLHTFSSSRDLRPLRELESQLVHASRLAGIGEMASGITHDINSPLQVIAMSGQLMEVMLEDGLQNRKPANPEALLDVCRDVNRATESILRLSEHLLRFSREIGGFRSVDLFRVIDDAVFISSFRLTKAHVELVNEVQEPGIWTYGSRNQLEQVFVNLINNACDAMAGHQGKRTLRLSISPEGTGEQAVWRCDLTDNGPGIPDAARERIFESFYSTKPEGKGTGLGLSIARGIVANHRGEIRVTTQTTPPTGTTFSILLPRTQT